MFLEGEICPGPLYLHCTTQRTWCWLANSHSTNIYCEVHGLPYFWVPGTLLGAGENSNVASMRMMAWSVSEPFQCIFCSDLPGIPHTPWELVLSLVSTENFLEHHPTFSAGPPNPALLQPPPLSHRCVWWPGPRWDPRHRQRSAGKEAGQTGGQAVSRPSVPPETEPPLSICSHSPRLCFYSQFTSVFRTKRGRCWGRAPLPACHFVILFA